MKKLILSLALMVSYLGNAQDYLDKSIKKTDLSVIKKSLNNSSFEGFTSSDLNNWSVQSDASSRIENGWYYYLVQTHQNIPVHGAIANVFVNNGTATVNNIGFVKDLASKVNSASPSISEVEAIKKAAIEAGLNVPSQVKLQSKDELKKESTFASIEGTQSEIKVALMYELVNQTDVKLVYVVNLNLANGKHWWNISIDASTGEFISKYDWVTTCTFEDHNHTSNTTIHKKENNFSLFKNESEESVMAGGYRVIPYYVESPNHGDFEFITDPDNATASPSGWHTINATNYTTTRGNNVRVYDASGDTTGPFGANNTNGPQTNQSSPGLVFDYAYGGPYVAADSYMDASQTNLFYMSNVVHDIYYLYGFDEASGNFQEFNFGNGGTQGDSVDADCQDGSGTNNANFATPTDGNNPRMQMYLWDVGAYNPNPIMSVDNGALAGDYPALNNNFAPGKVDIASNLSGELVLYQDATPDNTDACEVAVNGAALNGKIAVVRRGSCNFTAKVINAQNVGAIAVLVVNNQAGDIAMGGGDAGVSIPAYSINQADGENIITEMQSNTVNITFYPEPGGFVNIDGSFDNGIVSHEYGHGINIRLVGGRNNSGCVNANESMGEGWADYIGKILQLREIDNGIAFSGVGTFAVGQAPDGVGIRPAPYSGDLNNNPMDYQMLLNDTGNATFTIPHGVGSVWAGMLWDLTWDLIAIHGFDPDIYNSNGTAGNVIALNLVVEGFKLTACDPGFVDGRNAILQADQNLYGGANQCAIWSAFARRGLGVNANQGNTNSTSDGNADYTLPNGLGCNPDYLITNGDSGVIEVCEGTSSVTFDFVFNEQNGFDTDTGFAASGLPVGANATFTPNTMKDTGLFSMDVSNLSAGTHTITITPGGNAAKAITATLIVNPYNPDLTDGDTEYSVDGGGYTSFATTQTITVTAGSSLDLRVPNGAYVGSAVWTSPNGTTYNSDTVSLTGIVDGDVAVEGNWSVDFTFTNDCPNSGFAPQNMTFNLDVTETLSNSEFNTNSFKVYPNPTDNVVNVTTSSSIESAKFTLVDLLGRQINHKTTVTKLNQNTMQIDLSNLQSGVYVLSIVDNGNTSVFKIVKE